MEQGLRLRPRFALALELDPDLVVTRFRERLAQPGCPCRGMVAELQRVIDLRVLPEVRHLWSPALSLQVEPAEEGAGSVVHGLIGPEPGVWTGIAFAYVALATGLLFLCTLGTVQVVLGYAPWAFALAGLLLVALLATWTVSRAARRRAAPQTAELRHFLEEVLELGPEERRHTERDPYHA